ncbi:c-type cytochrome [Psychromonas algarum]|uniref:c-type cytochrome n=1 Tax=Psychromonas algarum TaxID=2555643 RepID=UPI002443DF19|nr:cytochrome c [Psychromonas sp. RZ22]
MKSPSCGFCHGKNGIAPSPIYPNLQGQKSVYLINSIRAYQQGLREGPMAKMMQQQLSKLNDQDLADIAAYYQSMKNQ